MAQPPGPSSSFVEDLDVLTGSPLDVTLQGRILRLYAVFSTNDVAHWWKILGRRQRENLRALTEAAAAARWERKANEANAQGTPPPLPLDMDALRTNHPDVYLFVDYERDIFNLLLSVWSKSELSKPEHEREPVTAESVRDLTYLQAERILTRLFPLRNGPRVPPPAEEEKPANQPEEATEAATSTASTLKAPSRKDRPRGQRSATSRSSVK